MAGTIWWHTVPVDRLAVTPAVEHRAGADGRIELLPERFRGRWTRWLQRWLPEERRCEVFALDERGSLFWNSCLVGHSVDAVIVDFRTGFPDDADQAEARVLRYLAALETEGCLQFVRLDPPASDETSRV